MPTVDANPDLWSQAASLAALHVHRTSEEVASALTEQLARLIPDTTMALCLAGDTGSHRVEIVLGDGCPWQHGAEVEPDSWTVPSDQRLSIRYREHRLGELVVGRPVDDDVRALLVATLAHYGVALVNLTLNAESHKATENYCASLQALEEGIVLFQEEDPQAVDARLLSLASSMLHATAAALYVLRTVGDPESGLVLETTLGIPETLLENFVGADGTPWPDGLLDQQTQLFERDESGGIAGLDPASVPPILNNIVAMPLRYHGVHAGICILFNSSISGSDTRDHIGRVQSLGQLGAALLHRLQLEAIAVKNRAIARELQIAESIQKRLIPTTAPTTDEYEFAWSSIAAQYIGGDYLDVMSSDLGDIHAIVADVSGHGINSAMLMSSFRSTYRGDAPWMEPGDLAASLNNEVVHEVGSTGMFITAVALRFESGSHQMTLTSAGHNPVMIYRHDSGLVELVNSHGPPLGFLEGASYEEQAFQLQPGDIVLLYTDGLTEAADKEWEMYGEERLAQLLSDLANSSVDEIVEGLRTAVTAFTGSEQFDDDVSILVVKAKGEPADG